MERYLLDLAPVVVSISVGLGAAALVWLFFWLKRRTAGPAPTDDSVLTWAGILVRAAEQVFKDDSQAKLDYVMMLAKYVYPNLREEIVRAIVEQAVYMMRQEQGQGAVDARASLNFQTPDSGEGGLTLKRK